MLLTSGCSRPRGSRRFARALATVRSKKRLAIIARRFRISANRGLSHELLDLGGLALRLVSGIRVATVDALLTETCAPPDEIVERALELLDAIGEVGRGGRGICHAKKVVRAGDAGQNSVVRLLRRARLATVSALMFVVALGRLATGGVVECFATRAGTGLVLGNSRPLVVVEWRRIVEIVGHLSEAELSNRRARAEPRLAL